METERRTIDNREHFLIVDLDQRYHDVARQLGWTEREGAFDCLEPNDSPHLDRIYRNFADSAESLILQRAGELPIPWDQALLAFLRIVDGSPITWYLVGSAALAVRGLDVAPGDIDLATDAAGAQALDELLLNCLVQPTSRTPDWIAEWFGRSFMGASLEWVGEVNERADTPLPSDFGPSAARRLETINWRNYQLRVPPLDLQLEVTRRRGRTQRAEQIAQRLREIQRQVDG